MKRILFACSLVLILCSGSLALAQTKKATPQNSKKADTLDPQCEAKEKLRISDCNERRLKGAELKKCHEDARLEGVELVIKNKTGKVEHRRCMKETDIKHNYGEKCLKDCTRGVAVMSRGFFGSDKKSQAQGIAAASKRAEVCDDTATNGYIVMCRQEEKRSALDDVLGKQEGGKNTNRRYLTNDEAEKKIGVPESGIASRYGDPGDNMAGSIVTASGAIRDDDLYHMASQHYPDGTVGIMKGPNGQEIPIVVNYSGAFYNRFGRNYDLSPAAANAIGITEEIGTGNVTFTPTYVPEFSTYKEGRTDYVRGFEPTRSSYYLQQFKLQK